MTAARPHHNHTRTEIPRYPSTPRRPARFLLGAALVFGTAAFARVHPAEGQGGVITPLAAPRAESPTTPGRSDMETLVSELKQGGYVVVFRHAPTNRDQADTDPLDYSDTAHQRLLSENGKEIARQIGYAFRTLGIPIGKVYTSKYNRAVETGKLIGGNGAETTLDVTEGGLVATPIENDRRAAALKALATTAPPAGTNTVIVTHKPNLVDAFGKEWVGSKDAEASVFKPDGSGQPVLVARVQAADWVKAAKASSY